jgi:hypothetical protein
VKHNSAVSFRQLWLASAGVLAAWIIWKVSLVNPAFMDMTNFAREGFQSIGFDTGFLKHLLFMFIRDDIKIANDKNALDEGIFVNHCSCC